MGRTRTSCSSVLVLVLASFLCTTDCTKSGVQMRVTLRGIEYAINTGKDIIKKELLKRTFEEKGREDLVEYHVRQMKITDVSFSEVEFAPVPGVGMRGAMKGMALEGQGNVWYEYSFGWFGFSDDIDFSLRISGIDISLVVSVGAVRDGFPDITIGSCTANINSVDITFEGSGFKQWIYNLFNGIIGDQMKRRLSKTLGSIICKDMQERTRKAMSTFPLTKPIDQWAAIDYQLTEPPTFTETYVDTFLKGEFKSRVNPFQSKLSAPTLKMSMEEEKMAYFLISEYTLNSAGEVYQYSGALNIAIAEWDRNLPLKIRNKLTTKTFEMAIPNLSAYGDLPMSVEFLSYKAPRVVISENNIRLYFFADATFKIREKNGVETEAFALRFDVDTDLVVSAIGDRIVGKITDFDYDAQVKHSNIGKIDITLLSIMKFIIKKSVISTANRKLQKGLPLPNIDLCEFKNVALKLQEKSILVGTDAVLKL